MGRLQEKNVKPVNRAVKIIIRENRKETGFRQKRGKNCITASLNRDTTVIAIGVPEYSLLKIFIYIVYR